VLLVIPAAALLYACGGRWRRQRRNQFRSTTGWVKGKFSPGLEPARPWRTPRPAPIRGTGKAYLDRPWHRSRRKRNWLRSGQDQRSYLWFAKSGSDPAADLPPSRLIRRAEDLGNHGIGKPKDRFYHFTYRRPAWISFAVGVVDGSRLRVTFRDHRPAHSRNVVWVIRTGSLPGLVLVRPNLQSCRHWGAQISHLSLGRSISGERKQRSRASIRERGLSPSGGRDLKHTFRGLDRGQLGDAAVTDFGIRHHHTQT